MRRSLTVALGLTALLAGSASGASFAELSPTAQEMFTESMAWMDWHYDPKAGYLYDFSASAALRHDTRSSAWYALGLLARNSGDDVAEAEKIIRNIISGQYKVPSEEWYGDYQKYPQEPYVGSAKYPAERYSSWDPNWRGFIGTTLILAIEEYSDLLSDNTQGLMLESLYNCSVGDSYRFGSLVPGGDNLWPSYSNPAIMRAFVSGWTGRRMQDSNMTKAGEKYAQEILDLFNEFNTLSEFNSGTYTGVSLFGLHLWSKYLPNDSIMAKNGPRMIEETWKVIVKLWHPGLRNMAGPWDRSYGYDMNRYLSLMALWLWPLIGKENAGLIASPQVMSHKADYAWAPVLAILVDEHKKFIPKNILYNLGKFTGEHKYHTSARYPPYDNVPRNFTFWVLEKMTIGAESYDQIRVGGATGPDSFNPAVVQWDTGDEISWISLYPTEKTMRAKVYHNKLVMTYPKGNDKSEFQLIVGTFEKMPNVSGWDDIQGLRVKVSGNVDKTYDVAFGGANGGGAGTINDFENWRFIYKMPSGFEGVPKLVLEFELI
ncbi:hypothetical protein DL764_001654 [Monosporascus ibericus]|uniref:Linalool dehydratase/isomerase domain-containing protein n=1 Tax=Monosporascus ibericus TaxID=155417 RepID=A0A4Q4TS51_9PEZI|nr:hypothetical protein DL764_001654 [Monosporascus ibericus]